MLKTLPFSANCAGSVHRNQIQRPLRRVFDSDSRMIAIIMDKDFIILEKSSIILEETNFKK